MHDSCGQMKADRCTVWYTERKQIMLCAQILFEEVDFIAVFSAEFY